MKVVVTDYTFDSLDVETAVLAPLGCAVVGRRCKTPEELKELVADADAVLTQFAPVDAAVIAAMGRAKRHRPLRHRRGQRGPGGGPGAAASRSATSPITAPTRSPITRWP